MKEIVLKRANVVKQVDSEDKAKALEAKGFVRAELTDTGSSRKQSGRGKRLQIEKNKEELP